MKILTPNIFSGAEEYLCMINLAFAIYKAPTVLCHFHFCQKYLTVFSGFP